MKHPLIDLHCHLDGSIPAEAAAKALEAIGKEVPEKKDLISMLQAPHPCRDLNEYLAAFAFPLELLRSPKALEIVTYELLCELERQGLVYVELRFATNSLAGFGATQEELLSAALEGRARYERETKASAEISECEGAENSGTPGCEASNSGRHMVKSRFILCAMRGGDPEANMETFRLAAKYHDSGVCSVDLAGAEALFPAEESSELFAYAKEQEIPFTIHAGEAAGPESIRQALKLGASRIGHGIRCLEDEALVKELAERQIPLEICPTSNIDTSIYPTYEEYPLQTLLEKGLKVTLNTDNCAVSAITLPEEYRKCREKLGLTEEQERTLYLNAVDAAFLSQEEKTELRDLLI